jgi:toxin YoeB
VRIVFSESAWEDYLDWQKHSKDYTKKINKLIQEIRHSPYEGIGKPEPLKFDWTGWWSRRIDLEHRIVYQVTEDAILIAQCRYHY